MDRLPVTFVLEGAIYSVGSKHQYYKRESGKPIKIISENQFTRARDQFLALQKSAKPKSIPNPKPKHPKSVKYSSAGLTLTDKQVDFLKRLPALSEWQDGKGAISVSCLSNEIGGQFQGRPMAIGAMITTLQNKNVLSTWKDRNQDGTEIRFIRLQEFGLKVLNELTNKEVQ